MPYLKKFRIWLLLLLWMGLSGPVLAANEGIQIKSAELKQVDDMYYLYAQMNVALGPMQEEAIKKGVSLYFITEFEFKRPRWYWLNEDLAHITRVTRLSYNALLRQYLVSGVNVHARSVDRLEDALQILGEINAWPVIQRDQLNKHEVYQATLSMRLDTSQLPKPLQINAIATGRWELESAPLVWMMNP
ncbi:MAG: DUF4390 domain-containing protein [Sulfuriferula sp.]|nr:DUF4390 domain-containing protein [Sulfuriferula sp.]